MTAPRDATPPLSHRCLDAVVAVLAVWTLLSHTVVVIGGNTRTLTTGALLVLSGWLLWRRRRRATVADEALDPTRPVNYSEAAVWNAWRWMAVAVPLMLIVYLTKNGGIRYETWGAALAFLAVALVVELRARRHRPSLPVPSAYGAHERVVWVLAALAVLTTLAVHRYNMDDVFYLSMAVDVADRPDIPLLSKETLHGIPDLPMRHVGYRLYTLEPLAGTLAFITGIDVIYWVHWVFAGGAAALLVLAYTRLLRLLVPGRWLYCLITVLLILVTFADGFGWNGAMAFVRLQQSKAIFVSVFLPLLMAYAIEHAQRPDRHTWRRLLVVQIAAAGTTTTALWMAPVVVGLGLLSGVRLDRRAPRTLALGVASSLYPVLLAVGLLVIAVRTNQMSLEVSASTSAPASAPAVSAHSSLALTGSGDGATPMESFMPATIIGAEAAPVRGFALASFDQPEGQEEEVVAPEEEDIDPEPGDFSALRPLGTMNAAKRYILGSHRFGWFVALTTALAWCLSAESLARRFALVFPVGFLLFLYNPLLSNVISRLITRDYTYWRIFWVLPGPILMALCLTTLVTRRRVAWRSVTTLALAVAFVTWGPFHHQWTRVKDFVSVWPIKLKTTVEYDMAKILTAHTPQNAQVLAPWGVSAWLAAVHGHPYPMSVRRYLRRYQNELGIAELNYRHRMTSMMTGKRNLPSKRLVMRGIRDYKIGAVCYPKRIRWDEDPVPGFYHHGFKKVYEDDLYVIWVRPPEFGSVTPRRPQRRKPKSPVPIAPQRLPRA